MSKLGEALAIAMLFLLFVGQVVLAIGIPVLIFLALLKFVGCV